jgi:hypothetical protein
MMTDGDFPLDAHVCMMVYRTSQREEVQLLPYPQQIL